MKTIFEILSPAKINSTLFEYLKLHIARPEKVGLIPIDKPLLASFNITNRNVVPY